MVSAASSMSPDEAIRVLGNFERRVGSLTLPSGLYELFSKTVYMTTENTAITTIVGGGFSEAAATPGTETTQHTERRFEIGGQRLPADGTQRVLETMRGILLVARTKKGLTPPEKGLLDRVEQQLRIVQEMAKDVPAQPTVGQGPQPSLVRGRDVRQLMKELRAEKINCFPSAIAKAALALVSATFRFLALFAKKGPAILIGVPLAAAVTASFIFFPAATVAWGLLGVLGAGAVAFAIGTFIYYAVKERSIKQATTSDEVVQAFGGMTAAGRAHTLVKLGPEFRDKLRGSGLDICGSEFFGGEHWPIREFCDYVDAMTDPGTSEAVKKMYREQVEPELKKWSEFPILLKILRDEARV